MATHEIEVKYYLYPTDEWVRFMKDNDGTRHWAGYYNPVNDDYYLNVDSDEDLSLNYEDGVLTYDTETLLRGLKLYALSHSQEETERLLNMETDSHERDHVWQLGFFADIMW